MNSLKDLRSAQIVDYEKAVRSCPPVSKALLAHLEKMFSRKMIKPTEPTMQQELVYQAGIDKVIEYLRKQNDRQEREVASTRTKGDV